MRNLKSNERLLEEKEMERVSYRDNSLSLRMEKNSFSIHFYNFLKFRNYSIKKAV